MSRAEKIEEYNSLCSQANRAVLNSVRDVFIQRAKTIRLELQANPTQATFG